MTAEYIKKLFIDTFNHTRISALTKLGDDLRIPVAHFHELCYLQTNEQVAFRAAWVLEYIAANDTQRFSTLFPLFFTQLHELKNRSCQRHFTKILMLISDPKAPLIYQQALDNDIKDVLIEVSFAWLIDPDTPVAVQANCLDILFNVSHHADWVRDELETQTHYLLRDGSAAMQSRGKKILKKIQKKR